MYVSFVYSKFYIGYEICFATFGLYPSGETYYKWRIIRRAVRPEVWNVGRKNVRMWRNFVGNLNIREQC